MRSIIAVVEWVGEVTTVVGALGGALVGVRGALAISRQERDHARQRQLGEAYAAFLAAIVLSVAELRQLPTPGEPGALQQFVDRTQDKLHGDGTSSLVARRNARAIFGDRPLMLADNVVEAWAVLRVLPLNDETRLVCDAALNYVERLSGSRADEVKAEWPSLHARLMAVAGQVSVDPPTRPRWLGKRAGWQN